MGLTTALLTLLSICTVTARAFNCNGSSGTTCNGLVGYISANATTLSNITTMFGIPDFRYLLGANNFLLSTPPNQTVSAKQVIKIPFTCHCTNNGTGIPLNRRPIYKVVAGDGLYHIACGGDRGGVVEVVSGDEFRCAGGVVDGLANDVEAEFGEREFARSQGLRMANDLQEKGSQMMDKASNAAQACKDSMQETGQQMKAKAQGACDAVKDATGMK